MLVVGSSLTAGVVLSCLGYRQYKIDVIECERAKQDVSERRYHLRCNTIPSSHIPRLKNGSEALVLHVPMSNAKFGSIYREKLESVDEVHPLTQKEIRLTQEGSLYVKTVTRDVVKTVIHQRDEHLYTGPLEGQGDLGISDLRCEP